MRLVLQRAISTVKSTPGKLFVDGKFECYTLEDVVRPAGIKVYGQTAIPPGTYPIQLTMSPHFGRVLPLLLNVPNFEGIRIHSGNDADDTDGCLLVGDAPAMDWLGQSRVAFDRLFVKLKAAAGPIFIDVRAAS